MAAQLRTEVIVVDGSISAATDWAMYLKRVDGLLTATLAASTASGEPTMPFRIGVAQGKRLAHFTGPLAAAESHGPRWSSELQHILGLLSRPVGLDPGVLALQALPTLQRVVRPAGTVVFVTPAGSRSLQPHLLAQVLASSPELELEILVVTDGATSAPVSLQTDLILLQARYPLKVGLLEQSDWDWSTRKLVERQRLALRLCVGPSLTLSCVAQPACLVLQQAYDLQACNCHGAILSPPLQLVLPSAPSTSGGGVKCCPCTNLPMDRDDLHPVTSIGHMLWPGALAQITRRRETDPAMLQASAGAERDVQGAQANSSSLTVLTRIGLEDLAVSSLCGDPWTVTADTAGMDTEPGLLACLSQQLHSQQQGLICRLRVQAQADDGRSEAGRSLASLARVVLLPQGPPHRTLLMKGLLTAPPVPCASNDEEDAAMRGETLQCDPEEERRVLAALDEFDVSDHLGLTPTEDGAAVAVLCLRRAEHAAAASAMGPAPMPAPVAQQPRAGPPPAPPPARPAPGPAVPSGPSHPRKSLVAWSRPAANKKKMPRIAFNH